jgi:hypothetical protein
MCNTIVGAGAVGAGGASRYGSGSDQKMRLLAAPAPAPQHCFSIHINKLSIIENNRKNTSVADPDPVGSGPFWS